MLGGSVLTLSPQEASEMEKVARAAPDREQLARIIDPPAFKGHAGMLAYCLRTGDDEATARRYADSAHGPDIAKALTKADAILAILAPLLAERRVMVEALTDTTSQLQRVLDMMGLHHDDVAETILYRGRDLLSALTSGSSQRDEGGGSSSADGAAVPKSSATEAWRGSRPDMATYDAATGEQESFIYLQDGSRLSVGGGGDPVEQAAAIIAAHNATIAKAEGRS